MFLNCSIVLEYLLILGRLLANISHVFLYLSQRYDFCLDTDCRNQQHCQRTLCWRDLDYFCLIMQLIHHQMLTHLQGILVQMKIFCCKINSLEIIVQFSQLHQIILCVQNFYLQRIFTNIPCLSIFELISFEIVWFD